MNTVTILVVDAEKEPGSALRELFRAHGYPSHLVTSGREALRVLQAYGPKGHIAVVHLDLHDSAMDGVQTIRQIKQTCQRVECILYTGCPDAEAGMEAVAAGAYCYVEGRNVAELLCYVTSATRLLEVRSAVELPGQTGISLVDAINAIPQEVSILDEEYRVLFANRECIKKHFGPAQAQRPSFIGQRCYDVFPRLEDRTGSACGGCPVTDVLCKGGTARREERIADLSLPTAMHYHYGCTWDGRAYPVVEEASLLRRHSESTSALVVHIVRDVSKRAAVRAVAERLHSASTEVEVLDTVFSGLQQLGFARVRQYVLERHSGTVHLDGKRLAGPHLIEAAAFRGFSLADHRGNLPVRILAATEPTWVKGDTTEGVTFEAEVGKERVRDTFAVPLLGNDGCIGYVMADMGPNGRPCRTEDFEDLAHIGRITALALQRVQLHSKLQIAHNLLDSIIFSSLDAVIAVDTLGRITEFNPAAENLTGLRRDQAVGRLLSESIEGHGKIYASDSSLAEVSQMVRERGEVRGFRAHVTGPAGIAVPVEQSVSRLINSRGESQGVVALLHDLSREELLLQRLRLIHTIVQDISKEESVDRTFQRIVESCVTCLGFKATYLRLLEDHATLPIHASFGLSADYAHNTKYLLREGDGVCGLAARLQTPIQVPQLLPRAEQDVSVWDGNTKAWREPVRARFAFPELVAVENLRAMLTVPLKYGKQIIGILNGYRDKPGTFANEDVEAFETFAAGAAIAIWNVRVRSQLQRRILDRQALLKTSELMSETLDPAAVCQAIAEAIHEIRPCEDMCFVHVFDGRNALSLRGHAPRADEAELQHLRVPVFFASQGTSRIGYSPLPGICDARTTEVTAFARFAQKHGFGGLLLAPLTVNARDIGVISVFAREPQSFSGEDESLIQGFARHAALTLSRAESYTRLICAVRMANTMQRSDTASAVLQLLAATITDRDGLSFNRIVVFRSAPPSRELRVAVAVGSTTDEKARRVWEGIVGLRLDYAHNCQKIEAREPWYDREFEFALRHVTMPGPDVERVLRHCIHPSDLPLLIERAQTRDWPQSWQRFFEVVDAEEFVLAPIRVGGEPWGVVYADNRFEYRRCDVRTLAALDELLRFCADSLFRLEVDEVRDRALQEIAQGLEMPVSVIRQKAHDMATTHQVPATCGRLLASIAEHATVAQQLIRECVSYVRMGHDRLDVELTSVGVRDVVEDLMGCFTGGMAERIVVRGNQELGVKADRCLMRGALAMIVDNGLKYSDGVVYVDVSGCEGGETVICVEDTGMGISEEAQPFVFSEFYRAPEAKGIPGIGLGLAIAGRYVEACGGRIEVDSHVGRGTRMRIRLQSGG